MSSKKKFAKKTVETDTYQSREEKRLKDVEATRKARVKRYVDAGLNTIGVRFASEPGTEYTYLLPAVCVVHYGMEVVVRSKHGYSKCAYITRIDEAVILPPINEFDGELSHVIGKVVQL